MVNGGYDEGYLAVPCLWGTSPGSLIQRFLVECPINPSAIVLDLGCGEGKNSAPFADLGCQVDAVDCSQIALSNGKDVFLNNNINWINDNALKYSIDRHKYDVIIAYGLLHCMKSAEEVAQIIHNMQTGTKSGGYNIICSFNVRSQDLSAHPGFEPVLLPHVWYTQQYASWQVIEETDTDLFETHPHNNLPHHHSLTRLIVRKR